MPYAIITGASQGLGKAIAEKLLSEGFSIAVCARTKATLQTLEKEWNERYPSTSIIAYEADLGKKEDVDAFANTILSNFPQVDILVNNAGQFLPGTLAEEPDGLLETLMNVNLYSAYNLTRHLLPIMKSNKKGHIFNMCSVASLQAYENGGAYSITKYALKGFSDNLREELKQYNIKVTALYPGAAYTPSWHSSGIPPERMMEAEDVANMLWAAYNLSVAAVVEGIIMRPVKGDL